MYVYYLICAHNWAKHCGKNQYWLYLLAIFDKYEMPLTNIVFSVLLYVKTHAAYMQRIHIQSDLCH